VGILENSNKVAETYQIPPLLHGKQSPPVIDILNETGFLWMTIHQVVRMGMTCHVVHGGGVSSDEPQVLGSPYCSR